MVTAFLHPLNILMLVLAILAGIFAAWWLAPLGLLLWLIMVFNQYRAMQDSDTPNSV
jgi:hypothetical protein